MKATPLVILSLLRRTKLAVIDYLQIYSQVSENYESSLGYMARCAKNVAKECSIAVILLSQLNRSADHPSSNMLRGSGQIKESADNVVLNVSALAEWMGINPSLMRKYKAGLSTPRGKNRMAIQEGLNRLSERLSDVYV